LYLRVCEKHTLIHTYTPVRAHTRLYIPTHTHTHPFSHICGPSHRAHTHFTQGAQRNAGHFVRYMNYTRSNCICILHTGWRRPIGCLISWITFHKSATKYRALLRKMTYQNKASYESKPPCARDLNLSYISYVYTTLIDTSTQGAQCNARQMHIRFIDIHMYIYYTYISCI